MAALSTRAATSWIDSDSEDDGDMFVLATKTAKVNVSPNSVLNIEAESNAKPKSQR